MSDQLKPIDLNSASQAELATIPGIGAAIAERIVSHRPFQSVEELTGVAGIGASALEKLRPYFYVQNGDSRQESEAASPQLEAQPGEPVLDAHIKAAEIIALPALEQAEQTEPQIANEKSLLAEETEMPAENEIEPAGEVAEPEILLAEEETLEPEVIQAPEAASEAGPTVVIPQSKPAVQEQPRYASRSDAFWISFGSSFLAFILAIGLTLGVLAIVNNGLRYVSPAQLNSVSRQVDGLGSQVGILQQDLDGLRSRVDNLEGLSGRVSTVEKAAETLRSDLDAASTQVEQLNQSVSGLQSDVTALQAVSDRFQNFLDGLRELLNNGQ